MKNPITGTTHKRHDDTVIVCAGNTFGRGANAMYCGRNPIDAATLDRFIGATLTVDYDRNIETTIAQTAGQPGLQLAEWVWTVRDTIEQSNMRRIFGTRSIESGVKLLLSGLSMRETKHALTVGWSTDELRKCGL